MARAARAYEGFLPPPKPGETFEQRVREHAKKFIGRGEPGASEIMANLFDADYLMKHELVFIGSPDTVAQKLRAAAEAGLFNVFLGEFNFSDLPADDAHALDPPVRRTGDSGACAATSRFERHAAYCAFSSSGLAAQPRRR